MASPGAEAREWELPLWRKAAGKAGSFAEQAARMLEAAPPALRPAAFVPYFLMNLPHAAQALRNLEEKGLSTRFIRPDEAAQARVSSPEGYVAPRADPLYDVAQIMLGLQGVPATAAAAKAAAQVATLGMRTTPQAMGQISAKNPIEMLQGNQVGAVKPPGGMWNPQAVEMFANQLPGSTDVAREWSVRAAKNYLNKYAGTERDPLKDVEIPFGQETRRWGEVADNAISSQPQVGPQGPEQVFEVAGDNSSINALRNYLSHVSDYLTQNVPASKLAQYDFVRAVKEAAANDARVAREMSKAQAADMASLPVYKEYDEGFKWVELRMPEKLTPEQAKGVRPVRAKESWDPTDGKFPGDDYDVANSFVALDAQDKPITNSYTRELAVGSTPEEAWLAGQLSKEGNTMGHCVGGYCPEVASGDSRIFSLRDSKGQSHVTVEVEPGRPASREDVIAGRVPNSLTIGPKGAQFTNLPDSIRQIKGKGNRAPNPEYLPYVQDFVRRGNWGEVRELGNAGLRRLPDGTFEALP